MANIAPNIPPDPDDVPDQPGQLMLLLPAGIYGEETPEPTEERLERVPKRLLSPGQVSQHNAFRDVFTALYSTLDIFDIDGTEETRYVGTRFLSMSAAQFTQWKTRSVLLTPLKQDIPSLYQLLYMCGNPGRGQQNGPLLEAMDNNNVNVVLAASLDHNYDNQEQWLNVRVFFLWITVTIAAVAYVHKKARAALYLHARIENLGNKLTELRNEYQRLLASLANRSEVNGLALYCADQHQRCLDEVKTYCNLKEQTHINNAKHFQDWEEDYFTINGGPNSLEDMAQLNRWYDLHHHHPDINPLSLDPLDAYGTALGPILSGIRQFQPSPRELALEQAANLKPSASTLSKNISDFLMLEQESKSLGVAKTFRTSLNSMRAMLQGLIIHGVILNADTTGMDLVQMDEYQAQLDDYISSKETQIRREEAQMREESQQLSKSAPQLRLPDLTGFNTWLSWRTAQEQILPLHKSDLIKKQLVKNSLKQKEDILRTKDLDFKSTMSYLELKYSSPFLIPSLVESMTKMKKAHSDRSSYENLTTFVSLLNQLRAHGAEAKLDALVRSKLAGILLHSTNLSMFYKDLNRKEKELKEKEAQEEDVPDGASMVSFAVAPHFEEERRKYWIQEILSYLEIVRKIVSQDQNNPQHPEGKPNRNYNRNYNASQTPTCPICHLTHQTKSGQPTSYLGKCRRFLDMDPKSRIAACSQYNFCKRCLNPKSDPSHNVEGKRGCSLADQHNIICRKCSPHSKTHHELLHDPDLNKSASGGKSGSGRGGSAGRGRGGRGGRGGAQRGRGRGRNNTFHASHSSTQGDNSQDPVQDSEECCHDDHHDDNDDKAYDDLPVQPLEPVSRDSLLANASCFRSKHIQKFCLDTTRLFLTCCSIIQIMRGNTEVPGICLLDVGSSIGYTTIEYAKRCRMKPAGEWTGSVSTINGTKMSTYPIFMAKIKDARGHYHSAKLLGTRRIGLKKKLPDELFKKLCQDFHLSQSSLQNSDGEINILLGLDSAALLSDKHLDMSNPNYPQLFVCSSPLSSQFFFCGSIGKDLLGDDIVRTLTFKQDLVCFHTALTSASYHPSSLSVDYNDVVTTPFLSSLASRALRRRSALNIALRTRASLTTPVLTFLTRLTFGNNYYQQNGEFNFSSHPELHQICHLIKPNRPGDLVDDAVPVPSLHCSECAQRLAGCRQCRYLRSEVSVDDLRQLQLMRDSVQVIEDPEGSGGKRLLCSYPFNVQPEEAFHAKYSNYRAAMKNSERLRQRVLKLGLADEFHAEIMKIVEQKHAKIFTEFTPELTPHNCVFINYVLKSNSVSQPIRPVSNSNAPNSINQNLNASIISGPNYLNSGLACLLGFRLRGGAGWSCDLSRAYRSLYTTDLVNHLRIFFWFTNVHDSTTMVPMCFLRVNFGDKAASLLLEIALRDYIGPLAEVPEVIEAVQNTRLVDDWMGSIWDASRLPLIEADIKRICSEYGFKVKTFNFSGQPDDENGEVAPTLLGLTWLCRRDLLTVQTQFFPGEKRRGKQMGGPLSQENIETMKITRQVLARLSAQAFSFDGTLIGPLQITLRILFSQACKILSDWTTELYSQDQELDKIARQIFSNLIDVGSRILPLERAAIPDKHELCSIVVASDASIYAHGYLIYLVSKCGSGKKQSRLIMSRPKIHALTVPDAELAGLAAAARYVSLDFLSVVPGLIAEINKRDIDVWFLTDSMCSASSLNPRRVHRDVRSRNCCHTTHRACREFVSVYKTARISFLHQKSENLPADLITRRYIDPVTICNSTFYRQGHTTWLEPDWPPQNSIFLQFQSGSEVFFQNPKSEQELAAGCTRCYGLTSFCYGATHLRHEETRDQSQPCSPDNIQQLESGYLEKSQYLKLISNCRSLLKVLGVIRRLIMMFRPGAEECDMILAWRVLIRSHQRVFKPHNIKLLTPHIDKYGIQRAATRLSLEDALIMNVDREPAIVSHHDSRLVFLLILAAHVSDISLNCPGHLSASLTLARLRQGDTGVWLTRGKAQVKAFIARCAPCLIIRGQPQQDLVMGSPRYIRYLRQKNIIYGAISADQLGPYQKLCFPGSRKLITYHLLVISCIISGALTVEILEKNDRNSILQALYLHSLKYCRPHTLVCDASTSIHPRPGSESYKKYFGEWKMTVVQSEASHQLLSNVEPKIKSLKRIIKSALFSRKNLSMPNLSYTGLQTVIATVCNLLNSQPIKSTLDTESVCPAQLLNRDWFLTDGDEDILTSSSALQLQQNIQMIQRELNSAHEMFVKILKAALISCPQRNISQRSAKNIFRQFDICLSLKANSYNLCQILHVKDNYCIVRSSERYPPIIKNVHCTLLVLIFRPPVPPHSSDDDSRPPSPPGDPCPPLEQQQHSELSNADQGSGQNEDIGHKNNLISFLNCQLVGSQCHTCSRDSDYQAGLVLTRKGWRVIPDHWEWRPQTGTTQDTDHVQDTPSSFHQDKCQLMTPQLFMAPL